MTKIRKDEIMTVIKKLTVRRVTALMLLFASVLLMLAACSHPNVHHTEDAMTGELCVSDNTVFDVYYYQLEDKSAVMDICEAGTTHVVQSFEFPKQSEYYLSLDFYDSFTGVLYQDMNFDGYTDLYVPCSVTTENLEGMAWLWDADKNMFVLSESLTRIPELRVDEEKKLVYGCKYSGYEVPEKLVYYWEDGKLIKRQ